MKKSILLAGLPLLLLASCGDDEPLGKLGNEIDEEFTSSIEIQENWGAPCVDSKLLNAAVRKTIEFEGNNFNEEHLVYSDSSCNTVEGTVKMSGDFKIEGGEDIKDLDLNYKNLSITANSEVAVNIFSAVNLCGIDKWEVGKETSITNPQGETCFIADLPITKYGSVSVDDSEDRLYMSDDFSSTPQDRPTTVDRSVEYNEID